MCSRREPGAPNNVVDMQQLVAAHCDDDAAPGDACVVRLNERDVGAVGDQVTRRGALSIRTGSFFTAAYSAR